MHNRLRKECQFEIQPQDRSAHHIPQPKINLGHFNPTKEPTRLHRNPETVRKIHKMRTNKRFNVKLLEEQPVRQCSAVQDFTRTTRC